MPAFDSPADVAKVIDFTSEPGLTDLYCQVYRNGRTWYPSLAADDTPFRRARAKGVEPLRKIIDAAHSRGQRVHAWINVLRILENRHAPLLQTIGREAVQVDSLGNSLLEYDENGVGPASVPRAYKLGTPGIWLDPASPKVRHYLVETIRDLIVAYPDLDGIHLDMVRYPFLIGSSGAAPRPKVGYSPLSLRRFFEFTGRPVPPLNPALVRTLESGSAWSTWRRAQVTLTVFQIKELINKLAPDMELSAAVLGAPDRAYHDAYQDWREWLRGRLLDTAVAMSYTRENERVRLQTKQALESRSKGQIIVGLGAWMMVNESPRLVTQGKQALAAGADGVTLFSYANLASPKGETLLRQFSKSVFPPP